MHNTTTTRNFPSGIFYKKFQKPIDIFYFMYYNINIVTNKKYIKRKVNGD